MKLIEELKQNNEDFELYPTTMEMLDAIFRNCYGKGGSTWLDIGAGTCNLKKNFKENRKRMLERYQAEEIAWRESGYKSEKAPIDKYKIPVISEYYAIEKSYILVNRFDSETICIGRDFHTTDLIDKPVHYIFCNPPYSEYEDWTKRIILEGNYSKAVFLVIPQRWKDNEDIQNAIKNADCYAEIIYSGDFLNAERSARAKIDVVKIAKNYDRGDKEYNESAFDKFFDDFFKFEGKEKKSEFDIEEERTKEIKNKLATTDSKAWILEQLYNEERERLLTSFKSISELPTKTLEDIGVDKNKVKNALKFQISGLKSRYWKLVFDEFSEITDRLTTRSRENLFFRFKNIKTIDFSVENIYPILLWVISNSNKYYDDQLLDWFKMLTSPENIKQYKSNERVFKRSQYRANCFDSNEKVTHYVLDYRIIMTSIFETGWGGEIRSTYEGGNRLKDIFTLANNLGFKVNKDYEKPTEFGQQAIIYLEDGSEFMRYRPYKNGNMHVKFNIEFMKAVNVTCSKLLGWIQNLSDIKNEFPADMAKGAEKYFMGNIQIGTDTGVKLLGYCVN